ncbi:MAG: hypothetical protein KID00_16255 [Clostridium argentinense]|uniref:Secreted protein n=1 Tax=Clostridium faecium TaxID=2762223 RepID=A0ABR8YRU9_9CLOT|nr:MULTISPECIES: hypothetical protein [Clostridium]MBD8046599.1 hypothetical protein [Clostridium faecium]MBS5825369.1 hypothetical protein [Clostridium argentinense]MDU1350065.1 hypothetical protein [Clostridium argentinense]
MFGCGCGSGNKGFCFEPCTIILIILILANQCLLNTRDCEDNSSRNALTLLFLFWLCGCNGRFGPNVGFEGKCARIKGSRRRRSSRRRCICCC